MARKRMVTRTVATTEVLCLVYNIETGDMTDTTLILSGTFKTEKDVIKAAEKVVNSDTAKLVHVKNSTVVTKLYGMTEQDFITHATVQPDRTTK